MNWLIWFWSRWIFKVTVLVTLALTALIGIGIATSSHHSTNASTEVSCTPDSAQLLISINQERTKLGVPALTVDAALMKSAQNKLSDEVTGEYYGHNLLDGSSPDQFIRSQGVQSAWSEDLNDNALNPSDDWTALRNSPSHYASVTNSQYTRVGLVEQCTDFVLKHGTGPDDNSAYIGIPIKELTVIHLAAPESGTLCRDGWVSPSVGRGTCSSHYGEQ